MIEDKDSGRSLDAIDSEALEYLGDCRPLFPTSPLPCVVFTVYKLSFAATIGTW